MVQLFDNASDPWGSDDEGTDGGALRQLCARAVPLPRNLGRPAAAPPPQPQLAVQPPERLGPDSLQATCLGVLAAHLEELLALGEEVLPLLPPEFKACLLAAAKLRGLLDDVALLLLTDEGQHTLDLSPPPGSLAARSSSSSTSTSIYSKHSGSSSSRQGRGSGQAGLPLTDGAIRTALTRLPQLRFADLRGCPVSGATLRALGQACPQLQALRLGSPVTDQGTAGGVLKHILPAAPCLLEAPAVVDAWDALLEEGPLGAAATELAPPRTPGRLMQLQCLAWLGAPHAVLQHCRAACPKVLVNPSAQEVQRRGLLPECDPATQLDAPLLAGVAGAEGWAAQQQLPDASSEGPVIHIADRFKWAYMSRARRVREKMERNQRQAQRRELRWSGGERAIQQYLESEL